MRCCMIGKLHCVAAGHAENSLKVMENSVLLHSVARSSPEHPPRVTTSGPNFGNLRKFFLLFEYKGVK